MVTHFQVFQLNVVSYSNLLKISNLST